MRWYIGVGTVSAMAAALAACGSFSGSGDQPGSADGGTNNPDGGASVDGGTSTRDLINGQRPANHFVQVVVATSVCSVYTDKPCGRVTLADGSTSVFPDAHSCALRNDRRVWCWGSNKSGRLGVKLEDPSFVSVSGPYERPLEVTLPAGGAKYLAAGSDHTCAVLTSGEVWCWGYNWTGQLGYTSGQQSESNQGVAQSPKRSNFLLGSQGDLVAETVEAGEGVTCARNAQGNVVCVGKTNDKEDLAFAEPRLFKQLSITRKSSCGVTTAGEVVCSGDNKSSQIGGSDNFLVAGTRIATGVSAVSVGGQHTCVMENKQAKCWGNGAAYGGSNIVQHDSRVLLQGAGGGTGIDRVETGTSHTCFLQGSKAYCVGRNNHGQAGPGNDPKNAPGESILGDVRDIAAATTHTCAVTTDGKVHCWGSNASKQLGVDNVERSEKAVPVPLPSD